MKRDFNVNASMGAASVCSNTCSLHCVRQYYRNIF